MSQGHYKCTIAATADLQKVQWSPAEAQEQHETPLTA